MMKLLLVATALAQHKEVNFKAAVLGFKGFLGGFQQGLYDDELLVLSPDCFGTYEANVQMLFIYNFINNREPASKVFAFVSAITQLVNSELENCGYT
jgi:hypothetical protein